MVAELAEWSRPPPLCATREEETEGNPGEHAAHNFARAGGQAGADRSRALRVRSIPHRRATSQGNHFSWPHADQPNEGQGFGRYFRTILNFDQDLPMGTFYFLDMLRLNAHPSSVCHVQTPRLKAI